MTLLTAELFASARDSSKGSGLWYSNFYYARRVLEICLPNAHIVKVRLTELEQPEPGCYWSWKQLLGGASPPLPLDPPEFHFTNSNIQGVEICFTYGSKAEESRGRGKVVPVKLEIIE